MAKGKHTGGVPPLEPGSRSTTVGFRVPDSQLARLQRLIEDRGVKASVIAREALVRYLDQELEFPAARESAA